MPADGLMIDSTRCVCLDAAARRAARTTASVLVPRESGGGLAASLAVSGALQQIPGLSVPSLAPNRDLLIGVLKRKHLVDSICVAKLNGSTIASTNGSSGTECILGTSMFKYINSELPKSESVFVKVDGNWLMIMPYDAKMYIVRAPSNLSTIELKAIAKELERALKRKKS